MNIIDTAGAKAFNQQQTVYIDCRGEDSYKAGHIKGAKNIPPTIHLSLRIKRQWLEHASQHIHRHPLIKGYKW